MVVISHPIIVEQNKGKSLDENEEEVGLFEPKEELEHPKKIYNPDDDEDNDLAGWEK